METCGECHYWTGEECADGPFEGGERYDDSPSCDNFEQESSAEKE